MHTSVTSNNFFSQQDGNQTIALGEGEVSLFVAEYHVTALSTQTEPCLSVAISPDTE